MERKRLEEESLLYDGPFDLAPSRTQNENVQEDCRDAGPPSYSAGAGPSLPTTEAPLRTSPAIFTPTEDRVTGKPSCPQPEYRPPLPPARGPIPKRGLQPTPAWRRTFASIRRSIPTPSERRLLGVRKQKMKIRRRKRRLFREAGEMQAEFFDRHVRKIISRFPVSLLRDKPPIYDYITAMYRETTKNFGHWVEMVQEHYDNTNTVWAHQYVIMDQVRKLRRLYMDHTADFVLHMGCLESSDDPVDRRRAVGIKEQVARQMEEYRRFISDPETKYRLRPLTHADIEEDTRTQTYALRRNPPSSNR